MDTHRVFAPFTQEANAEAEQKIRQLTNFCDVQGKFSRSVSNEGVFTLYSMTK